MKHLTVLLGATFAASTSLVLAAQPAPVIDVSSQPVNSSSANVSLSEQLANVERKLDARNRAQINMQRQLTDLQNEVDEIRGVTELHSHKLSQILERQRELYQELDRRVSQAIQSPQVPATLASNNVNNAPNIDYSSDLTENEAYDHAVNLVLKEKQYDQAIEKFKAFNKKYPNSTYAANAHYWLGQLLFTKNELSQAANEFSIVVNQHKDSTKRSDAMLKLAMVSDKQGDKARARVLYNQLIKEYPSTSAAQLAGSRLELIK
ncbi:tol-pal system protein YbgF [Thalassotalea agariperforans]